MERLDIGEVVRQSGMPASTLRFYEEKGLIAPKGRQGLRRVYDPRVLDQLALIALGRAAGFSLDDIALMFARGGQPRIDRQMLTAKADELDATIRKLSAMRDGLRHAAACPAPSHIECPTFRRILRAVMSKGVDPLYAAVETGFPDTPACTTPTPRHETSDGQDRGQGADARSPRR